MSFYIVVSVHRSSHILEPVGKKMYQRYQAYVLLLPDARYHFVYMRQKRIKTVGKLKVDQYCRMCMFLMHDNFFYLGWILLISRYYKHLFLWFFFILIILSISNKRCLLLLLTLSITHELQIVDVHFLRKPGRICQINRKTYYLIWLLQSKLKSFGQVNGFVIWSN